GEVGGGAAGPGDLVGEDLREHVVGHPQGVLDQLADRRGGDGGQHLRAGFGDGLGDLAPVHAEQLGERLAGGAGGGGGAGAVLLGRVEAAAVEHERLDGGDVAALDVGGVPAGCHAVALVA